MRALLAIVGAIAAALLAFIIGFGLPMLVMVEDANSATFLRRVSSVGPAVPGAPPALLNDFTVSVDNAEVTPPTTNVYGDINDLAGTLLGTQADGVTGLVIGDATLRSDPDTEDDEWYWQVNFDTGFDGWVLDLHLTAPAVGGCGAAQSFALQDPVRTDDGGGTINILDAAGGSAAGTQGSGSYGVISTLATCASGTNYWQVNFQNGTDGWVTDAQIETTVAPATLFATGQSVEVIIGTSNIRATPAGTLLGTQIVGAQGTISGGPRYAEGIAGSHLHWWYEVNFTSGTDGWIGLDRLQVAGGTPPPDESIIPPTADSTVNVSACTTTALGTALDSNTPADQVTKIVLPASCNMSVGAAFTRSVPVGETWVIDFETNSAQVTLTASVGFTFNGSFDATQTISSLGTSAGKTTATFGSSVLSLGWAAGDIIKVFSLNDELPGARLQSNGTNQRRMGELMQIESISGDGLTVTFTEGLSCLNPGPSPQAECWVLGGFRASRMRSGTVWLMGPRITGSESFGANQITFNRLVAPRVIRPFARLSGGAFVRLNSNWRPLIWETDFANGAADAGYCVKPFANKHTLIAGTRTITNCEAARHNADPSGSGTAGSSDPTFYGADHYMTARGLITRQMKSSAYSTHAEAWNSRYEQLDAISTTGSFAYTHRGREVVIDDVIFNTLKGLQIGVGGGVDAGTKAGDLDVTDMALTVDNTAGTVNTSAVDPAATFVVRDSTCNLAMSSLITKINSPGC